MGQNNTSVVLFLMENKEDTNLSVNFTEDCMCAHFKTIEIRIDFLMILKLFEEV